MCAKWRLTPSQYIRWALLYFYIVWSYMVCFGFQDKNIIMHSFIPQFHLQKNFLTVLIPPSVEPHPKVRQISAFPQNIQNFNFKQIIKLITLSKSKSCKQSKLEKNNQEILWILWRKKFRMENLLSGPVPPSP